MARFVRFLGSFRSLAAGAGLVALLASFPAAAAPSGAFTAGIADDGLVDVRSASTEFALLGSLHAREVRLTLPWGGAGGVATARPTTATNPADPAYNWAPYDAAVTQAAKRGIRVLFTIYGTPTWANGGRGVNHAPSSGLDLRNFAYAAALRYSGTYRPDPSGPPLPAVRDWEAWNAPNDPSFLAPQYQYVHGTWVVESALMYATICNSIFAGIHVTALPGERVACGATAPYGNDDPTSARPSVSPLAFLTAVRKSGLIAFDAWSHHAGPLRLTDAPGLAPTAKGAITLANLGKLRDQVTALYGALPVWVTGYGYPTRPPSTLGVSGQKQARYLSQAFALARSVPGVTMLLWSGLVDASSHGTGLVTAGGVKKPAFGAFRRAARPSP